MAAVDVDVAELMRRLVLAEAERDAERARAAAERARAAAERARADAAEKATFVAKLDGMAASGSESSPSDEARRGAPLPVVASEDAVAGGFPAVDEAEVGRAWERYCAAHAPALVAAGVSRGEVNSIQPVVACLSRFAAGAAGELRVWLGKAARDDSASAEVIPDQVWTHSRDASPSLIGSLVIVEVKKPKAIAAAIAQAAKYLRRRVAALFHEADARGEPGDGIFAVAAASDGHRIALLRMASGAPADKNFRDACPCPVLVTEPLPLLSGWDFVDAAWRPPNAPPRGFSVLARVLRAPASAFGPAAPLSELSVTLGGAAAAETLRFGERLGCGGTSDVYEIAGDGRFAGACAKLPRFTSALVDAQFRRESEVLAELAQLAGACVPRLVCDAERESAAAVHRARCRWPLLVISPAGTPLCAFVSELVARGRERGGTTDEIARRVSAARRTLADLAASSVLRTLRAAHAKRLVHCDVRPANLVVLKHVAGTAGAADVAAAAAASVEAAAVGADAEGGARVDVMLVDWGLCAKTGDDISGRGVPAFAPAAVFTRGAIKACPFVDLVAVAHTWLAIALGSDACSAPWTKLPDEPVADTHVRRDSWLAENLGEARVIEPLLTIEATETVAESAYSWPPAPRP